MQTPRSMRLNILRWLAFPLAVIALMLAGLVASILLLTEATLTEVPEPLKPAAAAPAPAYGGDEF